MKYLRTFVLKILLPVLILAGGIFGFKVLSQKPEVQAQESLEKPDPLVEWVAVQPHDSGLDIETDGVVVPHREIMLSAEVSGKIVKKTDDCEAGKYVEAGTLLYEIDPRDYQLEARRLAKELAQADANLRENEVEIKNAETMVVLAEEDLTLQRKDLQRVINLSQRKVVTESNIDEARREELASRNALQTQKNLLQLQKTRRDRLMSARDLVATQLEKAQLELERTKIVAPSAGVIIEDYLEQDDHVQSGENLVRINDSSTAEVKCGLKMEELFWVWNQTGDRYGNSEALSVQQNYEMPETPVTVIYELMGLYFRWEGVLSRYEGTGLDIATRTIPCRVLVKDPRGLRITDAEGRPAIYNGPRAMVTGMYVTVRLHAKPTARLLSLPENAIRPGNKVWVVRDGVLSIETIRPAETLDGRVVLSASGSKIEAGDHIVTSPLAVAHQGMKVREQEKPATEKIMLKTD